MYFKNLYREKNHMLQLEPLVGLQDTHLPRPFLETGAGDWSCCKIASFPIMLFPRFLKLYLNRKYPFLKIDICNFETYLLCMQYIIRCNGVCSQCFLIYNHLNKSLGFG